MDKKILIYFGAQLHKRSSVEKVLHDLSIPYQILSDEDLHQTTGFLMGLESFEQQALRNTTTFEEDLMIMQNITDEEITNINQLLQILQTEMKRKAMLTQHNQHWRVSDLLQEICKEHRYFQDVEAIRKILLQSSELIVDEYTTASWKAYEKAFYTAYECISKDTSSEEVATAHSQLVDAKESLQKQG